LRAVPIIRTSERLDMSISNVCAQDTSSSIEDILLDWADYSELLLHQIETEIFENNDPKQFNAEYVKLCDVVRYGTNEITKQRCHMCIGACSNRSSSVSASAWA